MARALCHWQTTPQLVQFSEGDPNCGHTEAVPLHLLRHALFIGEIFALESFLAPSSKVTSFQGTDRTAKAFFGLCHISGFLFASTVFPESARLSDSHALASPRQDRKRPLLAQCDNAGQAAIFWHSSAQALQASPQSLHSLISGTVAFFLAIVANHLDGFSKMACMLGIDRRKRV